MLTNWNSIFKKKTSMGVNSTDFGLEFFPLFEKCKNYSMTSIERMYSLYKAIEYILKNNIKGDFVECGVWRGGSAMFMAHTLRYFNSMDRKIYLYDTFEGMSKPTKWDIDYVGRDAGERLKKSTNKEQDSIWAYSSMNEVQKNIQSTDYPMEQIVFIKGKVEDTIPTTMPQNIALLRLDTDWYESTKHELENLYPLVQIKGVLIIDDYGYWKGSKKAVDEYFKDSIHFPLLHRIDNTGRMMIKL
jgi:O-methyltransferase